jgi:hypothetical protein
MPYYIYSSDAKVDMLLMDIPVQRKKHFAMEFKIDLKVLGFLMKPEARDPKDPSNRFIRLATVIEYLRETKELGTIDNPKEWIEDSLPMNWGLFERNPKWDALPDSPLVFFCGSTAHTVVGLGGSAKHLIGTEKAADPRPYSLTPYLLGVLTKGQGPKPGSTEEQPSHSPEPESPEGGSLAAVLEATEHIKGPKQKLKFLAKRLLYGTHQQKEVLLATPLYVALEE